MYNNKTYTIDENTNLQFNRQIILCFNNIQIISFLN